MRWHFLRVSIVLIVFSGTRARAIEYPNDLTRWVVAKAPELGDEHCDIAEADTEHEWFVYLRAGQPSARLWSPSDPPQPPLPFAIRKGTPREGLAGRRLNIKVGDGWIISFNAGEWGGGLWWFSPDGSQSYNIATDFWVNGLFPTDAGLLVMEGISHGQTRGRIVRLVRRGDRRYHVETFFPLTEEPRTATKDLDGTMIVVTYDRLLRFHPSTKRIDVLVDGGVWSGLWPNSVIVSRGAIFVGMRHGVARVQKRLRGYQTDWLEPMPGFDQVIRSRTPRP
jgi:hypothetical protein